MKEKNICNMCGFDNPKDNFICEHSDCGAPMDLNISINDIGLPEIKTK
tara:strand:- start:102 stop:245 length:144 start_codon:yes stop_codon:yes gene_type:complete